MFTAVVAPPIPLPINAKLTLYKETGKTITDDATGNKEPVKTSLDVYCSLVPSSYKTAIQQLPGANTTDIYLEGYTIKPKKLPAGMLIEGVIYMELFDLATGSKQKGEFTVLPVSTPFMPSVVASLGTPLMGFFRRVDGL